MAKLQEVDRCIVVFARLPVPGQVKTRLIPSLGEEGACEVHTRLLEHTLEQAGAVENCAVELWLDSSGASGSTYTLPELPVYPQKGRDLGERMHNALASALTRYPNVVLVGTDIPQLNASLLDEALQALAGGASLVAGPAQDGGYYLIGLKAAEIQLFTGINWGEDKVLDTTLHIARRLGLVEHCLKTLQDVDCPEDLLAMNVL